MLNETGASETRVGVSVNYSLTGALAQFSRGAIVKELAAALTRDFSANLRERISASQTLSGATIDDTQDAQQEYVRNVAIEETQPLNAGRLFWRMLWTRVSGWFKGAPL